MQRRDEAASHELTEAGPHQRGTLAKQSWAAASAEPAA